MSGQVTARWSGNNNEPGRGSYHLSSRATVRTHVEDRILQVVVECPRGGLPMIRRRCRGNLDISAPTGTDLVVEAGPADATINRWHGDVQIDAGSGDVLVEGILGDVEANTGSGDIDVSNIFGTVVVESSSGRAMASRIHGEQVTASNGSGDVQIHMDTTARSVEVSTGSGKVALVVPTGSYRLEINSGSGARSVTGIANDPGAGSAIQIETGSGDISVTGRQAQTTPRPQVSTPSPTAAPTPGPTPAP